MLHIVQFDGEAEQRPKANGQAMRSCCPEQGLFWSMSIRKGLPALANAAAFSTCRHAQPATADLPKATFVLITSTLSALNERQLICLQLYHCHGRGGCLKAQQSTTTAPARYATLEDASAEDAASVYCVLQLVAPAQ